MNYSYFYGVAIFISFFVGWLARGIVDRIDKSEDYGV